MQADDARDDADEAKLARTDSTTANTHATAAAVAASAAEAAQVRAATARDDAQAAYMAAMGADNSVDAEMYQKQAEAANDAAAENNTGMTGAAMAYVRAKDAAAEAKTAANTHVRDLLRAANASGETDADDRKDEVTAVAMTIGVSAAATGNGSSGTTATVTWANDTPDDSTTEEVDESAAVALSMTIDPGNSGTPLQFHRMTVAATDDEAGVTKTATDIGGLPGFMHGYEISSGREHVLVFTDKEQGTGSAGEKTVTLVNTPVRIGRIAITEDATVANFAALGANTTYDHDGDEDTDAVSGTYTCLPMGMCEVQVVDGEITGFLGTGAVYFSTTGAQVINAEVDAVDNVDYLVFGVWLREDDPVTDQANQNELAVGAFAASGNPTFATPTALYGTATYRGAAAGLYTQGSAVDYFQGAATLTAEFGDEPETGDDTADGTITGMINSIVAGGRSMADVIRLNSGVAADAGNITNTGAFTGTARMGTPMVDGDLVTYAYNGLWSGQFYGAPAETGETDTTTPAAAAGTFGVTGTTGTGDDAVTRSYVGAFGARR